MAEMADGPLSGVRVIDLTQLVMGPLATQTLADLGADVIKVESPEGDVVRRVGPSLTGTMGPIFLHLNRNKRSVVLDLKDPAARERLLQLVATADVLVHSYRPQAMARLGLAYDDVRRHNPRLVYAGLFGFGQDGPYAADGAFDDMIQLMSGLAEMMGRTTDGRPRYVPANLVDRSVGLYAFGIVAAALYGRERTGMGQEIAIPMFETFASMMLGDHLYGATYVPPRPPQGYPRLLVKDRGPYPTSDGYICCMIYTQRQWDDFLRVADPAGALAGDERIADLGSRARNAGAVFDLIAGITRRHPTDHWLPLLRRAGLTAVRMATVEDLVDDPHLRAVGQFVDVEQPSEGRLRLLRLPGTWSGWAPTIRRPPPELGEHTDAVLTEIGAA